MNGGASSKKKSKNEKKKTLPSKSSKQISYNWCVVILCIIMIVVGASIPYFVIVGPKNDIIDDLTLKLSKEKDRSDDLNIALKEANAKIVTLQLDITNKDEDIRLLNEKIDNLEKDKTDKDKEISNLKNQIDILERDIISKNSHIRNLEGNISEMKIQIADLQRKESYCNNIRLEQEQEINNLNLKIIYINLKSGGIGAIFGALITLITTYYKRKKKKNNDSNPVPSKE